MSEAPLKASIKHGVLTIRVGLGTLLMELQGREEEDVHTMLRELFCEAIKRAIENGCEGFDRKGADDKEGGEGGK